MTGQPLAGKTALVTGGSRGIGAATARKLATLGAAVAVGYATNAEAAAGVVGAIRATGGAAESFMGDVGRATDVAALVAAVVAKFGRIDILVNNAAIYRLQPLGEIDAASFAETFTSNVLSIILMTQAVLSHLPSPGGRIINVASRLALSPTPTSAVYAGSKAAVIAVTQSCARALGPRGITVNVVAPGVTDTDMMASTMPAQRERVLAGTPLGRIGEPEDVADVIAFLATDDARWMTGKTLIADGGMA